MGMDLHDAEGGYTRWGNALRYICLLAATLSCLLLPVSPIALLSPMLCDAGCSPAHTFAAMILFISPLLWLVTIVMGFTAFNDPSTGSVLLALVPAATFGLALLLFYLPL